MRIHQHIIDSKAVKRTLNSLPDHWVIRGLSERDYGIDLMVEIFSKIKTNKHGHGFYEATGRVCYLQIKGKNSTLKKNKDKTVSYKIDKKSLLYFEKFATPFILVNVCTLGKNEDIYFLWLQRYIIEVLDVKNPTWRKKDQDSFTLRIPIKNRLPKNSKKIEMMASRIKYLEESAEFIERYSLMQPSYQQMMDRTFLSKQYDMFILELRRISNLSTLLELNDCQVRIKTLKI